MKRVLLIVAVLLIAFFGYRFFFKEKPAGPEEPKVGPLVSRKHSATFDGGIDSLMNAYFEMKDAFVNSDSVTAKAASEKLIILADSSRLAELKTDTSAIYQSALAQIGDVRANAESLVKQPNLNEMKQDFRMVSESLYPLLKTLHYDGKILYWQNCPMAFGEDKGASWISNTAEIVNPYLGKNHPEYKGTMLHCGEIKDSIRAQ